MKLIILREEKAKEYVEKIMKSIESWKQMYHHHVCEDEDDCQCDGVVKALEEVADDLLKTKRLWQME